MKTLFAAAAVAAVIVAAPASAETFATFTQQGQPDSFSFTNNGDGTATLSSLSVGPFDFDFWPPGLDPALASQDAIFSMSGTASTPAGTSGPGGVILEQMVDSGTISFTRVTPYNGLTNLLTISFTEAFLWGPEGSRGVNYIGSSATGTVTFTSDFLDFSGTTRRDFAFALTGLSVPLTIGSNGLLTSFTGDTTGIASADGRIRVPPGAIPEPATWGMMIMGFAGIGAALRSRRRVSAEA